MAPQIARMNVLPFVSFADAAAALAMGHAVLSGWVRN
jgi:hypothetical protein